MFSARYRRAGGGFALLASLLASAGTDTQRPTPSDPCQTPGFCYTGVVRSADGEVANEEVHIDGHGAYLTSDSGEFAFPPLQGLDVGSEAIFHVKHWVVVHPCELKNGRMYLPSKSVTIEINVLQRGDPRLIKVAEVGSIMRCLIEQDVSQFRPKPTPARPPRAFLPDQGQPFLAQDTQPMPPWEGLNPANDRGQLRVVEAAYHIGVTQNSAGPFEQKSQEALPPERYEFLARKAEELGFSVQELASAIDAWTKSVEDLYDKGLAALYEGRYAEASAYIKKSIASTGGDVLRRYVPLARAEYEQGHYPAAESALRKVLAVHNDDPIVLNNLGLALEAQAEYGEAEPLYQRALKIDEKALGPEHPDVATDLNNLALLYDDQGKYAEAEPLYQRALKIDEKALGPEHPTVALYAGNLAATLRKLGRDSEARVYEDKAAAIRAKINQKSGATTQKPE